MYKRQLLNIGEEDTKGDLFAQEAHRLLTEAVPAFAGNCEGGDLMAGDFDVVVTDGFTGNVCLKTIEGTAKTLMRNLKAALMSTALSKVGALLVKGPLGALKEKMSPETYGGCLLYTSRHVQSLRQSSLVSKALRASSPQHKPPSITSADLAW